MPAKRILVAPLNWGLGHATRCIPLIFQLQNQGFEPIIASDGPALLLLQKRFPQLKHVELPNLNIMYPKKGIWFKTTLVLQLWIIARWWWADRKAVSKLVSEKNISGIISDSRPGVCHPKIPKVYLTHQLQVFSGKTSFITGKIHRFVIRNFDECWVPDAPDHPNLSGQLSHYIAPDISINYIGILSRFRGLSSAPDYDFTILLSGPEPQRSLLEQTLLGKFEKTKKKVLLIRGILSKNPIKKSTGNIITRDYLAGNELESALQASKIVIARSGYSTIMDLSRLQKKAFFIPTPGQYEQQYLANYLEQIGMAPFCQQENFSPDLLERVQHYSGLNDPGFTCNFTRLFSLFKCE